jgi:CHASE2 domain-containing sensor protein
MASGARRHGVAALTAALVAALLTLVPPSALIEVDRGIHDAFVRQTAPPPVSQEVAIVAIDEASLSAHGQWPWPRDVVATLVERLSSAGAAAIAFDVLFPEADRLSAPASAPGATTATDAVLAAAVARAPVVLGVALTFGSSIDTRPADRCRLRPVEPIVRQRGGDPLAALFQARDAVCSIRVLAEAARASGTINVSPDEDGVLRRIPVLVGLDGRMHTTLALAAVATATGRSVVVDQGANGLLELGVGDHRINLDASGQILVRPRGPGHTYPYYSAADVLAGRIPSAAVRGRVVFVGATALGVRDTVSTALDPRFPGVELHATLADAFLGGAGASRAPAARLLELLSAIAAAVLAVAAIGRLGGVIGGGLIVAAAVGAWFSARGWFAATGLIVSPSGAVTGLSLGAGTSLLAALAFERQRVRHERRRREQAQRLIVQTLTTLTETRDAETGQHARRTQELTRLLATTLAARGVERAYLSAHRIDLIATLAPLHDIGKVGVSDAVLHKTGHLTEVEYAEMKRHTSMGHDTLLKAEHLAGVHDDEVLALAKDIVFTHHERWDGTGYPRGLKGDAIPLPGRLVALVDTYDALVSRRAYKSARSHAEALSIITEARGTHFDPAVVDAFLACHADLERLAHTAG